MKRLFGVIAICTLILGLVLYLINIELRETDGLIDSQRQASLTPHDESPAGTGTPAPKEEPISRAAPISLSSTGNSEPVAAETAPATPAELAKWKKRMRSKCNSLAKTRAFSEARYCYGLILAQDPDNADAHLGLGIMAARTGNIGDAYYHYQKFIEFAPDDMRTPAVQKILDTYDDYLSGGDTPPGATAEEEVPANPEGLPETLSPEQIYGVMKRYFGALKGCADQQRRRDPGLTGMLELSFVIQNWGRASDVKIMTQEHKGSYIAGCISYVIKNMHFPRFTGKPIPVKRVPFKLGKKINFQRYP